jgi:hypothetical protein
MNRKTLILAVVLIMLIALAYVYQGPLKKWQNNLGKPKNILAKIETAGIDKIEVAVGDSIVVLARQGARWKYNNTKDFYAAPELTARVLDGLRQAAAAEVELVSNNQERKGEFGTDSAGLGVKIYQADKKIADFIVGNQAGYGSCYVSNAALGATYLIKTDLRDVFAQTEWRDPTIFSSAKEKIEKIRFQYPNREFTVELREEKWGGVLPEKFTVSQEKIDKISGIMAELKAEKIPEQIFKNTGLEKHLIIIEASGQGVDNVLMIGEQKKDGLYYAKRGDSDNIYLINKSTRDELDKWIWQLR